MSLILQTCVACVVVTAVWLLASGRRSARNRKQLLARVPYVDLEGDNKSPTRYVAETGALIAKGYNQYAKKNLPFSIPNLADFTSPIVVLPLKYLDEVAQASQSQLSLKEYFDKVGSASICFMVDRFSANKTITLRLVWTSQVYSWSANCGSRTACRKDKPQPSPQYVILTCLNFGLYEGYDVRT